MLSGNAQSVLLRRQSRCPSVRKPVPAHKLPVHLDSAAPSLHIPAVQLPAAMRTVSLLPVFVPTPSTAVARQPVSSVLGGSQERFPLLQAPQFPPAASTFSHRSRPDLRLPRLCHRRSLPSFSSPSLPHQN